MHLCMRKEIKIHKVGRLYLYITNILFLSVLFIYFSQSVEKRDDPTRIVSEERVHDYL